MTLSYADRARFELVALNALQRLATDAGVPRPSPNILWNLRGKSCMGIAIGQTVIRLHPEFAELMGDAYADTVIHEACHIFVTAEQIRQQVFTRTSYEWSSHGGAWKRAMRSLGVRPNRCGDAPREIVAQVAPGRRVTKVEATCACTSHQITLAMAKRLNHTCRKCKSHLSLTVEARAVLSGVAA